MATYGKKASEKVEAALRERKLGTLKSGGSGTKVTSKKQAIAIGLSEARREGGKVPPEPGATGKAPARKASAKKAATKTPARKTARTAPAKTATRTAPGKATQKAAKKATSARS